MSEIIEVTVTAGPAGPGVAKGGTVGQVLSKKSVIDYDTQWVDASGVAVDAVLSVNENTPDLLGDVTLTALDLGLGNVDNTADLDKPVSTATEQAIEDALAGAGGFTEVTPFNPVLTLASNIILPNTTVSGALAFSVSGTPGLFTTTYVKLTSNGTNTPTFPGMTEWGGSLGWDNTAGMVNNVAFFNDGTTTYYSITQDLGATPVPMAPGIPTLSLGTVSDTSIGLTWTLPSGGIPTDYIVEFRVTAGTWGVFSDGVSTTRSATVTGLTPETAYEFRVSATNAVGTSGTSNVISESTTATPVVTETIIRLSAVLTLVESGNGTTGWLYTNGTSGTWADYGIAGTTPITGDGWVATPAVIGSMVGVKDDPNNASWPDIAYIVYADVGAGSILIKAGGTPQLVPNVSGAITIASSGATHYRVRRDGSDYVAEISTNNKISWTVIDRRVGTAAAGNLYPWIANSSGVTTGPVTGDGV